MAVTSIDKLLTYRRSDDSELIPLDSPTTQIGANSTTPVTGVSLGFTFNFDNAAYTQLSELTTFGVAALVGTAVGASSGNLFTFSTKELLAPWYCPGKTAESDGYVKTELQGDAPFRRFVIEWRLYLSSSHTASDNDTIVVQLVLYETRDLFEFRYGARARTGTPSAAGCATGFKGDTTSESDNYRDLSTDLLTLGGSDTTSDSMLDETDYDALVGTCVRIEPNWPMCGRYVPIEPNQLAGIQHPYNEPMWWIANNVNWLYCRHCPPLVCWAPHTNGTYSGTMRYAIPITPSYDGLTYRVYLITYSSAGGNLAATVDRDNATDPQPDTDGDWSNLATPSESGTSAGHHDWTSFTVTLSTPSGSADYLRITLTPTSGTAYLAHVLVVPEQLDDFDETATPTSGWLPMGLGQLRQRGAAVHPEWYNRAWRNVSRVVNDRRQMVWAYGRGDHVDAGIANTAGRSAAIVGVAPASIRGWRGVTAEVSIYAYGDSDGGTVQLVERGGNGLTFEVDQNSDEYYLQTEDLELVSEEPFLVVGATVINEMKVAFCGLTWVPGWADDDLFKGVTPAPSLEKLIALVNRIHLACTMPYAMTGLATPLERVVGSGDEIIVRWQVPPATKALRPKVARINNDLTEAALPTQIIAVSSGGTANDIILVPNPHTQGAESYPWDDDGGDIVVAPGAELFDDSPTSQGDRLLESPTLNTLDGPAPEKVTVTFGAGMTLVPYPADPYGI